MKFSKMFLFLLSAVMLLGVSDSFAQSKKILDPLCIYRDGTQYTLSEGIAAHGDDLEYVRFCCKELGVCRRHNDSKGYHLTHVAARANWTNAVIILVDEFDAPIESWMYSWDKGRIIKDYTQLMFAVRNNNFDMAKFLIDKGANTTMKNQDGHDSKYFVENLKNGDKDLIAFIKAKWQEEMGYSEVIIKEKKDKLLNVLTLDNVKKELASANHNVVDFRQMI